MYLCGPGKHSCQPFCGPEGRFYCSDSVCSLWPAPFSYLCVSVMILCVLKTVCGWTSKNWLLPYACCGLHFIDSAACVLSFDHSTPLHYDFDPASNTIGQFSEAGLHEWMPFVIFCARSCERLQRHFWADFWAGVHAVYNNRSWT